MAEPDSSIPVAKVDDMCQRLGFKKDMIINALNHKDLQNCSEYHVTRYCIHLALCHSCCDINGSLMCLEGIPKDQMISSLRDTFIGWKKPERFTADIVDIGSTDELDGTGATYWEVGTTVKNPAIYYQKKIDEGAKNVIIFSLDPNTPICYPEDQWLKFFDAESWSLCQGRLRQFGMYLQEKFGKDHENLNTEIPFVDTLGFMDKLPYPEMTEEEFRRDWEDYFSLPPLKEIPPPDLINKEDFKDEEAWIHTPCVMGSEGFIINKITVGSKTRFPWPHELANKIEIGELICSGRDSATFYIGDAEMASRTIKSVWMTKKVETAKKVFATYNVRLHEATVGLKKKPKKTEDRKDPYIPVVVMNNKGSGPVVETMLCHFYERNELLFEHTVEHFPTVGKQIVCPSATKQMLTAMTERRVYPIAMANRIAYEEIEKFHLVKNDSKSMRLFPLLSPESVSGQKMFYGFIALFESHVSSGMENTQFKTWKIMISKEKPDFHSNYHFFKAKFMGEDVVMGVCSYPCMTSKATALVNLENMLTSVACSVDQFNRVIKQTNSIKIPTDVEDYLPNEVRDMAKAMLCFEFAKIIMFDGSCEEMGMCCSKIMFGLEAESKGHQVLSRAGSDILADMQVAKDNGNPMTNFLFRIYYRYRMCREPEWLPDSFKECLYFV